MISIIHPSRGRPNQAYLTKLNWLSKCGEVEYILSVDSDDPELEHYLFHTPDALVLPNRSAVEAINEAAKVATGNLFIVISDDFDCPDAWDTKLLEEIGGEQDFLVKTRDGIQPTLITLPIMDRKYYERFGYVYNPDYLHLYADTEMTVVGMMLGRVLKSDLLFKHNHYTVVGGKDAINEKNDATNLHGEFVFNLHKSRGFGIENPVMTYEQIEWHPNPVKLSILIATIPHRTSHLFRLAGILTPQLCDEVEVIIDCSLEYNIGVKRNKMLAAASGEYIAFVDDDDLVSGDYVSRILGALGADCIGISGVITTNGIDAKQWHISREFGFWHELNGVYYRTPNHISPVRRELALKAGFPEIENGEDAEYSRRLLPLLKTENKIEGNIYWYQFVDSK